MLVMTCNIRYSAAPDGENDWPHRKALCFDAIASRAPDVICFQEMMRDQLVELREAFPGYDWNGTMRAPGSRDVPNAVFTRREVFVVTSSGGYWLSETPHVPGSSSWASADVRLANWVTIEERASGRELRIVNTHLDHVSQPARENQARLLAEDARAFDDAYPQILTGDMNCDARNPAIGILRQAGWRDTYEAVHGPDDPGPTLHEFLGPAHASDLGRIDWIFTRGNVRVLDAEIIRDSHEGRYPSDHYFVSATLELVAP
ncbi:MAG: endonuclease/exonuclease/phosphatase family protein [Verrucomicrobia bacterium]|nr:endonuclease/exonuclease/phosphatase family protein [Verrucomicrobiota bacterium]